MDILSAYRRIREIGFTARYGYEGDAVPWARRRRRNLYRSVLGSIYPFARDRDADRYGLRRGKLHPYDLAVDWCGLSKSADLPYPDRFAPFRVEAEHVLFRCVASRCEMHLERYPDVSFTLLLICFSRRGNLEMDENYIRSEWNEYKNHQVARNNFAREKIRDEL